MIKIVEVMCPAYLNLFYNDGMDSITKKKELKLINQTVNIYDKVYLRESKKEKDPIRLSSNQGITLEMRENIIKIVNLFFEYTKVKHQNMVVEVEKINSVSSDFGLDNSLLAGILLGLNHFYRTELTKKELLSLAYSINPEVAYFIISGFAMVTKNGENIKRLSDNPYQSYLVIDSLLTLEKDSLREKMNQYSRMEKFIPKEILFNDAIPFLSDEVLALRKSLSKHVINHSLSGISSLYFVASVDEYIPSGIGISLKKEFPNFKFISCKNTAGHKILTKYL